jgi:hypothetical protein
MGDGQLECRMDSKQTRAMFLLADALPCINKLVYITNCRYM